MKKKIIAIALCVALVAVGIVGATLAYFTDVDQKTNVFTAGNIDIALDEKFGQNSELVPGTSKVNAVQKEVTVKNEGSKDAYVRVHIAVPSALVDQNLMSYNDLLHWNFKAEAWAPNGWSLKPTYTEDDNGWTDNGWENQNAYNTTIGGVDYTVWVVTYRSILEAGETTDGAAMTQMYLDWRVDASKNADGQVVFTKDSFDAGTEGPMTYTVPTDGIKVYVVAEGTQTNGFENAYDALNAAFGKPGTYTVNWTTAASSTVTPGE